MSEVPNEPNEGVMKESPRQLSIRSFLLALAILLGIFVFLNPVWESSVIGEWDQNIWWSYAPIPLVAAIFLALEKKFGLPALFLESMKLTFFKFSITFIVSNLYWGYAGAPGTGVAERGRPTERRATSFMPYEAPPATDLGQVELGALSGTVLDSAGVPLSGAFVRIASGLEQFTFAPPGESLVFTHTGTGLAPDHAVAQTHQLVEFKSATDEFHTAVISDEEKQQMLNFPLLPRKERALMFDHAYGLTRITCSIHGQSEPSTQLLILGNPFYTVTDEDGGFRFEGVPAKEVRLSVRSLRYDELSRPILVGTDAAEALELRMP